MLTYAPPTPGNVAVYDGMEVDPLNIIATNTHPLGPYGGPYVGPYANFASCNVFELRPLGRWLSPNLPTISWTQEFIDLVGDEGNANAISSLESKWVAEANMVPVPVPDDGPLSPSFSTWSATLSPIMWTDDTAFTPDIGMMAFDMEASTLAITRLTTPATSFGGFTTPEGAFIGLPVQHGGVNELLYWCATGGEGVSRIIRARVALNSAWGWDNSANQSASPSTYGVLMHEWGHVLGLQRRPVQECNSGAEASGWPTTAMREPFAWDPATSSFDLAGTWAPNPTAAPATWWENVALPADDARRIQILYSREVPSSIPVACLPCQNPAGQTCPPLDQP